MKYYLPKSFERYYWNITTNEWNGDSKEVYSKVGITNSTLIYNWDKIKKGWIESRFNKTIFDEDGKTKMIEIFEIWKNNKFEPNQKRYYYFSSSNTNLLTLSIESGSLNNTFKKDLLEYSAIANTSFKIIAIPEDKKSIVTITYPKNITSSTDDDRIAIIKVESPNKKKVKLYKVIFQQVILSVEEFEELQIYPNPTSEYAMLSTKLPYKLNVFNSKGQEVYPKIDSNGEKIKINFENLNLGLYMLVIESQNRKIVKKVLKI